MQQNKNLVFTPRRKPSYVSSTKFSRAIDFFIDFFGRVISWLWLVIMVVILVSVISRYVFGQGSIMLEEMSWHLYGVAWLVGLSYAVVNDEHVRVDVLYEKYSLKARRWIEIFGILFMLLPFSGVVLYDSLAYFTNSYAINETSPAPDGLPARWLLKFFIPFSLLLLMLAGVARLLSCFAALRKPASPADEQTN